MDRLKNQVFSEEDLKQCPFHNKKVVQDSPFKERITINSETENSAKKSTAEDQTSQCPYKSKMPAQSIPEQPEPESDDEPKGGCPVMSFKRKLNSKQSKSRSFHSRGLFFFALYFAFSIFSVFELRSRNETQER